MNIYSLRKYCVYLTVYSGNKLPPFYIGSSDEEKINSGYRGSVQSKKYKKIWEEELRNNQSAFKTIIICYCDSRENCLSRELELQKKLNVVKSTLYINESFAQPNGFHGMNNSGKNHPSFGLKQSKETKDKISKANSGKKKEHLKESNKDPELKKKRALGYKIYALNKKLKRFNVQSKGELLDKINSYLLTGNYYTKSGNVCYKKLSQHFRDYGGTYSAISLALERFYIMYS